MYMYVTKIILLLIRYALAADEQDDVARSSEEDRND
jgi:hypothetical protein